MKACNFIKKRLQHKCFLLNIAKILRAPILRIIWQQLLLYLMIPVFVLCQVAMLETDYAISLKLNLRITYFCIHFQCLKSLQIWVISGPYFPVFGLNTEIYSVNLCIQSEYRKIRTRNNFVFGHFLCSILKRRYWSRFLKLFCWWLSQRSPFREKTAHEFRSIIEHFLNYEDTRNVFGKMDGRWFFLSILEMLLDVLRSCQPYKFVLTLQQVKYTMLLLPALGRMVWSIKMSSCQWFVLLELTQIFHPFRFFVSMIPVLLRGQVHDI